MFQAHFESTHLIVLAPWFDGFFQPVHLIVIGIITLLLFDKRLPDIAFWFGKKTVEWRLIRQSFGEILANICKNGKKLLRRPDDDEPGGAIARLGPPDKPRPPEQVALKPPKSPEDWRNAGQKFLRNP